MSYLEDRCVRIVIDRDDLLAVAHSRNMLNRTADTNRHIKARPNSRTSLTDLMIIVDKTKIDSRSCRGR